MTRETGQLQGVFGTLQDLRVAGFRHNDWCRFIDYPHGAFTNVLEQDSACNVFGKPPQSFDKSASADFVRVKHAVADAGVGVWMIWNFQFDALGQVTTATFELDAGAFDRFSYVYYSDPQATVSKETDPEAKVVQQIDGHWWFVSDDFN
jgi:hypothetical protein